MKFLLSLLTLAAFAMGAPRGAHAEVGGPAPRVADAQPFRVTEHFRFFGDPTVESILERLATTGEERFQRLCTPIAACARVKGPIDVWVATDADAFAAGFPEGNPMSEWAAGVTFLDEQRIILRAHGSAMLTLNETFDHELAHVLAHTYETGAGRPLPRWFHEGLAIWQAGEGVLSRLETAMRAASSGHLLSWQELSTAFPNRGTKVEIAYAQAALMVKRMVTLAGPRAVIGILQDAGQGIPFETSFATRLALTPEEVFDKLDEDLESTSSPFLFLHDGNALWSLMTLVFLVVAWWRVRDRKRQMARLADSEERRIAEEDMALLAERTRVSLTHEPEQDPKLLN